jgi:hypothetical protein
MDEKNAFIKGFEKQAGLIDRARAFIRLQSMPKTKAAVQSAQTAFKVKHPLQAAQQFADKPMTKIKKGLGIGLLGAGAGAYGLYKLQKDPNEQKLPPANYQPGGTF